MPGLQKFQVVSEKESTRSFNDFRGDPTYDTTYLLELAATATGSYTLGPVTARDATGRAMTSDPMRVEVVPAASAPATGSAAHPDSARAQVPATTDRLHGLLMVLGTLAVIFMALYVVLAVFTRVRPVPTISVDTPAPTTDLPAGLLDERELFALLSARYGRDVRPLTTREIAELEADPDDRVHVTALLDHVRASRYADRHS